MEDFPDFPVQGLKKAVFTPYADNGGSVVAIGGEDYVVIGADTRLSGGYSIYTRGQKKLFKLSETTVLGTTGCWCDTLTLNRLLQSRMQMYLLDHRRPMRTPAVAQMLSTMLYFKRFFPYSVGNVLAGLDKEGKGCVYGYDPIGHFEQSSFRACGSGGSLLQPLLDNQIGLNNLPNATPEPLEKEKAIKILKDVFISATERDIYTGDSIFNNVITAEDGIVEETFELRKD